MATPAGNSKTYSPTPPENSIENGGFDSAKDRPLAPMPREERRTVDPARMSELARGGTNGEDAPSGKIQE